MSYIIKIHNLIYLSTHKKKFNHTCLIIHCSRGMYFLHNQRSRKHAKHLLRHVSGNISISVQFWNILISFYVILNSKSIESPSFFMNIYRSSVCVLSKPNTLWSLSIRFGQLPSIRMSNAEYRACKTND